MSVKVVDNPGSEAYSVLLNMSQWGLFSTVSCRCMHVRSKECLRNHVGQAGGAVAAYHARRSSDLKCSSPSVVVAPQNL
jgi:hypothetical protein